MPTNTGTHWCLDRYTTAFKFPNYTAASLWCLPSVKINTSMKLMTDSSDFFMNKILGHRNMYEMPQRMNTKYIKPKCFQCSNDAMLPPFYLSGRSCPASSCRRRTGGQTRVCCSVSSVRQVQSGPPAHPHRHVPRANAPLLPVSGRRLLVETTLDNSAGTVASFPTPHTPAPHLSLLFSFLWHLSTSNMSCNCLCVVAQLYKPRHSLDATLPQT